ncbi:hypothetical protein J5N97_002130 [Dioscorea zingiberensis]|uniref:RRP12-like protein n=1 Tax=Dioscorea zingiberensis TaxID=325984 RepID=A0A9D5D359_9LILI|nr:hypothetical protein J5N97_002130 [Dioscorea zingiberensis]
METDVAFSDDGAPVGDRAAMLLERYQNSNREDHQHLCAVIGGTVQTLIDQGITPTPVAYFAAIAASLDSLSHDQASASDPVAAALVVFLSEVIHAVPHAVVNSRRDFVADALLRILGFGSLSEEAVIAALKCLCRLIIAGHRVRWDNVSRIYGAILGFITDPRPRVRNESHKLVSSILLDFQGSPILAMACEGITTAFERFLLLAGGSKSTNSNTEEGPRGAMEVLYILNSLKHCLPLMLMKSSSIILKYCKSLLELRQSIVTRAIMEILQQLCLFPNIEVEAERLSEVLCSLATCVSEHDISGDGLATIARLLHVGFTKLYDLKRETCIMKLPLIFNALGDILASEHEEAIFAATEALKKLIYYCVDESLVNEGVEQAKLKPEAGVRKSAATIIEKLCATLDGFLGYRYSAVWDMCFQVLSAAFDKLGVSSLYLMSGTVKSLADMQNLSDEDLSNRKELHECVGSAVRALGPEAFLSLQPLNLEAENASDANVWLLPILKQYIVGARLSFFLQYVLGKVKSIQQKSLKSAEEGRIFSARSSEGFVYSLWSLFPAFCNYPIDTSSSFKLLQSTLCSTLQIEPELRGIICSSLQILIRQNNVKCSEDSLMPDDELDNAERKARDHYTPEVKEENLKAIKSTSPEFLTTLTDILLTSSKDHGGFLQATIHEFASITEQKYIRNFFGKIMQKFLMVTKESVKLKQSQDSSSMQIDNSSSGASLSNARALLLDAAVSVLPGLGKEEINLLLIAIRPAFQEEGLIQKKAYKVLSSILRELLSTENNMNGAGQEAKDFLSSNLDPLLELMIEALPSCHFSAKRHRLEALYFLIVCICKHSSEQRKREIISAFLTEIILALKENNKKTRNRAYDLLVEIGHACGDEEKGGKEENLHCFFNMVAGGLAGETPHMISAAVKGLARLAYEFSDLIGAAYNLLPSAFLLLQRKNREVIKANLGLIKVLVAKSGADKLEMNLKGIVDGLLKWQDGTKNHFKAKVKLLIEMLVRKCGLDAVKAVMPEEHMKLLTNIRKTKERKERKAKSELDAESLHSRTTMSRQSRWNHTRIFSDFGDEDDDDDSNSDAHMEARTLTGRWSKASTRHVSKATSVRSKRARQAAKSLSEDMLEQSDQDPLDLLDRQRTRAALRSTAGAKRKPESFDEPAEIDPEGRLIVHEGKVRSKQEKERACDHDLDSRSQKSGRSSVNSLARSNKKRQKTTDSGWAYTGGEYKSKKAGGDLKKNDKMEPYAYWPLDRKLLNRRAEHKAAARKGMASVMKFTKSFEGKSASSALAVKGAKLKKKQKKGSKKSR